MLELRFFQVYIYFQIKKPTKHNHIYFRVAFSHSLPLSSWLEPGDKNTKIVGLIPAWAINLRFGHHDPSGSLPTQKIL